MMLKVIFRIQKMSKWVARGAMIASWLYYSITLSFLWQSGLMGKPEAFWEFMEFPTNLPLPPAWILICGVLISIFTISGLAYTYISVEKIIGANEPQDFLLLSKLLQNISTGLLCFWLGYNLLTGLIPMLTLLHIAPEQQPDWGWDPLDIDIVFVILAAVLFAIARAFRRAWFFEDENKHFL